MKVSEDNLKRQLVEAVDRTVSYTHLVVNKTDSLTGEARENTLL